MVTKEYIFIRQRLGFKNKISGFCNKYGEYPKREDPFGPYLYRHVITCQLVASWHYPAHGVADKYAGEDIGMNTDALLYYKSE